MCYNCVIEKLLTFYHICRSIIITELTTLYQLSSNLLRFYTKFSRLLYFLNFSIFMDETKHLLVLERMNRGAENFKKIQKITGLERDELASILEDLEKRGLMKVEEKSGLFGHKVELYLTDKGSAKIHSKRSRGKDWFYDLIKGDKQFVFVAEVPGPDDKIMVRLIDGMLNVRGTGGFSKEVPIEGSKEMQVTDFKYRNGVLTLRIS